MDQALNIEKIEFMVTDRCFGRCIHCSQGGRRTGGESIDAGVAARAVYDICKRYDIKTVMTFGGEPMLNDEAVYAVHSAAKECRVSKRQVITNGCFTKDKAQIKRVCKALYECGVNDLLLSVDAFHAQWADMESVKEFAKAAVMVGIPIRLQPAWIISREHQNAYNIKTEQLIGEFEKQLGIVANDGNIIFPEGNAAIYLKEYFEVTKVDNPYVQDEKEFRCVSVSANGDLLGGNIYKSGILEIIDHSCP